MRLNEIRDRDGATKGKKRLGRGIGSGLGKTSGRGVKGQKARTGVAIKGFEGGQMPLHRRLPKRGFNNALRVEYAEVNLVTLQKAVDAGKIKAGDSLDGAALVAAGVISHAREGVRLLGKGALTAKLNLKRAGVTKAARAAVEAAGGSIELPVVKPVVERKPRNA